MPNDDVTVVVATRDRWPDLQRSLSRHQSPVILVDNGSKDGTPSLVRRHFPHVRVLELGRNRGAVARNVGVRKAETTYVAFADDDSWWAPGALAKAVSAFNSHPRLGLLAATVLVGEEARPDPISALMAGSPLGRSSDLPGPSVLGFLACSAVVRREAYLSAGGFDNLIFFMGEEERLSLDLAALGWGLSYVESVVAHHHPSPARSVPAREVRAVRNRVLTALLRRPWPVVAETLVHSVRAGQTGRAGVVAALPRLPQALVRRRPLPPHVEAARRLLSM